MKIREIMQKAETIILEFRRINITSQVPQERRHILELQGRADKVAEQLL
jgi:hypothetical protein